MLAKLSILGLYNYTEGAVFDDLTLPDGLDRQRVIDTILINCAELGLVYGDPGVVQHMIGTWSRNKLHAWERILLALETQYDPLHNYDRHEIWTDKSNAQAAGSNSNEVAGFNQSAGMADRDRSEQETSSSADSAHDGHIYGNIGVTTSMTMLREEVDGRQAYDDMAGIISDSFKANFCIQIY